MGQHHVRPLQVTLQSIEKKPGCVWVSINGTLYGYHVDDHRVAQMVHHLKINPGGAIKLLKHYSSLTLKWDTDKGEYVEVGK